MSRKENIIKKNFFLNLAHKEVAQKVIKIKIITNHWKIIVIITIGNKNEKRNQKIVPSPQFHWTNQIKTNFKIGLLNIKQPYCGVGSSSGVGKCCGGVSCTTWQWNCLINWITCS